ncbi:MAG TPA: S8 family serine peptidase, partial [Fimbriimonas sp.]|nr:S8 family serine peptidase [Fimbriimonas sp.]
MRNWSIRALTLALVGTAVVPLAFGQRAIVGPPSQGGNMVNKPNRMQKMQPRPYTVLVAYKAATESNIAAIEKQLGIYEDKTCRSPYFKRYFISQAAQLRGVTVDSAIRFLQSQSSVRLAEPDMPVFPDQVNDPNYGVQWGLNNTGQSGGTVDADVDAPEAWALIPNMTNVMVAVLDDAIEINHADLFSNIAVNTGETGSNGIDDDGNGFVDDVRGWDFVGGDNDPSPPTTSSSHGTHVAGLLAQVSNNAIGGASASRNVKILPVRFYDGQSGWMSDLILGIDYSRLRGVKAVSISYNLDGWTQLLADAFVRLKNADIVAMCSAGNNAQQNPARLGMLAQAPNICFVASSNRFDQLSSFSNYGLQVPVTAPGEDVYSTLPFGTYGNNSGTSMATPFAAGVLG